MSWLDKIAKKRLEELEAHPELNSDKFAEKMSISWSVSLEKCSV